jgi:uncharacterized protein (DUF1015 family)
MADVRPFRGLRPADALAGEIIAPPYDVLTEDEARALAQNPRSFVHVTRSEVDLPAGADAHSQAAYLQARATLDAFIAQGLLKRDEAPTYYFYGQTMGEHHQVGVLAACSVDEYDRGLIKKHEFTRPDKEDDRTHHMEVLDAQVGLVFLTYKATSTLRAITEGATSAAPVWDVVTEDGVRHALWPAPTDQVEAIRQAFAQVPALYVADGHHRSAAASRVHASRGDDASAYFLAGLYPDDSLYVMAYNRVVDDLNGLSTMDFLAKVAETYALELTAEPVPAQRGTLTMYLGGSWYLLTPHDDVVDTEDPVGSLDVAVLQDRVLGPVLGIDDPRRSTRVRFLGGIRGADALSDAVDEQGAAVAFHMHPTGLDQLFRVADTGEVMPPKSTWFEPKLREGVVVRSLRQA